MMWLAAAAVAWLATAIAIGVLGLCRAAANGDRAMHAPLDDEPWAALVRRLEGPTSWCATCAQPITDDRLWCGDECAQEWLS